MEGRTILAVRKNARTYQGKEWIIAGVYLDRCHNQMIFLAKQHI